MYTYKRGFTLTELLTVIAIIGILSSIVMVNLATAKQKGRDAKRTGDLKNIQLSLEQYYNDNLKYPNSLATLSPTYISVIPTDPLTGTGYFYTAYSPNTTTNCLGSGAANYHLGAAFEANSTISGDADISALPWGVYTNICTGSGGDFDGKAPGCVGTTADTSGADNCYDVTSN